MKVWPHPLDPDFDKPLSWGEYCLALFAILAQVYGLGAMIWGLL